MRYLLFNYLFKCKYRVDKRQQVDKKLEGRKTDLRPITLRGKLQVYSEQYKIISANLKKDI